MVQKEEKQEQKFEVGDIPPTKLIFYEDETQVEFAAQVLRVLPGNFVALTSTAFYPRGGGQEPDFGTIGGMNVDNVIKVDNVVLHHIAGPPRLQVGDSVKGSIDYSRRTIITRHHTATHIVNGACRSVLGPWVWQHSAFKDVDMGRLDITHFSHLTREDVTEIERLANEIVRRNLPVVIRWIPRIEAEQQYGFRLYQGGVAPVKDLRIVNIEGFDIEACGGTHVKSTGEIGMIKITKTERVQDGVERLEFVAGSVAVEYIQSQERLLMESAASLETPIEKIPATISHLKAEAENSRRNAKQLAKRHAEISLVEVPKLSLNLKDGLELYTSIFESGLDSDYHLLMGDRACIKNSNLVYVALFEESSRTRLIVFSGDNAQTKGARAGAIAKEIAKVMGGSGGGNNRFAQGGVDNRPEIIPDIPILINSFIGTT